MICDTSRTRLPMMWASLVLACTLLAACGHKRSSFQAPKELPSDTHYHALPQVQLGLYAVFLPPDYSAPENADRTYPLVVILHGHGSTEIRHGQIADVFGRSDVIYLAPRAPYPHHEVFIELDTPGWTAMPTVPEQLWDIGPGDPGFVDVDRLYTQWIADTVNDVRAKYRVNNQRVTAYGHSQGAAFAHLFAVDHPELVKAYYAFAGYYGATTDQPAAEHAQRLNQHRIYPFLAHNRRDPMVGAVQTDRLIAYFKQHGVKHGSFISETGDHYLTDEGTARATKFIRDWCCGSHATEEPNDAVIPVAAEPPPE